MVKYAIAKGETNVALVEHAASRAGKQSPSIMYDDMAEFSLRRQRVSIIEYQHFTGMRGPRKR